MLSERHNIHFHTVIHPKTPRRNKHNELVHPQVDDMEGGAQWNNSGKSIISVHRATFDTKVADIQVLKAKPRVVGKRGTFCLNFDPALSRYFELDTNDGGHKRYASPPEEEKPKQITQMSIMQNDEFLQTPVVKDWRDGEDLPF